MKTKKITTVAMMTALAILSGYVESLFPPPVAVPGIKLGLSNAVLLVVLYTQGEKETLIVALLKVGLCSLLFGTGTSFVYSLCGMAVSLLIMMAAKRTRLFSVVGVSSIGGIFHNMGQLLCAFFFIGKGALLYIPVLCLSGALCGVLTGTGAALVMKKGGRIFDEK